MSINPVEACSNHSARLAAAIEAKDGQLRRIENAYSEVLSDIDESEDWENFLEFVEETLGDDLRHALETFYENPVNELILTPSFISDLLGIPEAIFASVFGVSAGFLAALDASSSYDEWNHQRELLTQFEDNISSAAADYRQCICKAMKHPS